MSTTDRSIMLKLTRWTVAHRRIVVLSWLVLGLGLLGLSQTVGSRTAENFSLPGTNSQHALDELKSRFPAQAGDADQIVFYSRTGKLTDPPCVPRSSPCWSASAACLM
jgi:putative drug exporter of the RND superfamily